MLCLVVAELGDMYNVHDACQAAFEGVSVMQSRAPFARSFSFLLIF